MEECADDPIDAMEETALCAHEATPAQTGGVYLPDSDPVDDDAPLNVALPAYQPHRERPSRARQGRYIVAGLAKLESLGKDEIKYDTTLHIFSEGRHWVARVVAATGSSPLEWVFLRATQRLPILPLLCSIIPPSNIAAPNGEGQILLNKGLDFSLRPSSSSTPPETFSLLAAPVPSSSGDQSIVIVPPARPRCHIRRGIDLQRRLCGASWLPPKKGEYRVAAILGHCFEAGQLLLRVQWKGFGHEEDSWEWYEPNCRGNIKAEKYIKENKRLIDAKLPSADPPEAEEEGHASPSERIRQARALEFGEALLTSSIRPEAYVALTNGASIQFFRVTPRDSGTFAYLASDPLPLSAPIAKSLLCFMLTSEALFPNLPLFGDFRLAELQLLSETSNSRVVAATILTAPSGVALRNCVLKTVKHRASFVRNEREALAALKTVAPHVPVVLAASSLALLLAPLGRRIKLIEGFFPEELVAAFVAVLQRIHALGWCHRDLRPSNLLQTEEGQPLLIDFGFARQSGSEVVREGDLLYSADRLLQLRLEGESETYLATPQDDCEALVKVLYPMPTRWLQDLRRHRGDTAEYLQFWRVMAEWPPLKEALAAARREPIDYDALKRACERLLGQIVESTVAHKYMKGSFDHRGRKLLRVGTMRDGRDHGVKLRGEAVGGPRGTVAHDKTTSPGRDRHLHKFHWL
ncbi:hypothetical protein PAPYR_7960 [Paratrimastix pyriformis]|uniref:Protein kinase domain-containing protein n=1 Tax=Paratrimastix pyriformis TaxID=342808 RepID=A0ABQ8UD78_9EUKA|nr:hypothetical protein PAPYR_7960 [Paratrimastix pyriformis]